MVKIMYICSMKKVKTKILQHHFSVSKPNDDFDNYLVITEIVDEKPRHTYVAPMYEFKFWREDSPYYVFNNN